MANKVFRSFLSWSLQTAFGAVSVAEPVKFYVYAVNADYGFNHSQETLADVTPGSLGIKSKEVTVNVLPDGSTEIAPIVNLFEEQELVGVTGILLVAEWMDGAVQKSRLVAHMDVWDQSIIPVNTTERIKLAFEGNFLFRVGNVGPL